MLVRVRTAVSGGEHEAIETFGEFLESEENQGGISIELTGVYSVIIDESALHLLKQLGIQFMTVSLLRLSVFIILLIDSLESVRSQVFDQILIEETLHGQRVGDVVSLGLDDVVDELQFALETGRQLGVRGVVRVDEHSI